MSYIALGLNFSAIRSGQGNFLSPHEITAHSARINTGGADRLITKLTDASLALTDSK